MKKIIALAVLFTFRILSGQIQDERFVMRIVEPKKNNGGSIGSVMLQDIRITTLFKVEVVKSRKVKDPVIQIVAPDGFRIGTCFLTRNDATMLNFDYYKEIERKSRQQWENMRTLESYKKFCINQKG